MGSQIVDGRARQAFRASFLPEERSDEESGELRRFLISSGMTTRGSSVAAGRDAHYRRVGGQELIYNSLSGC
jgi:hypothetical protein